MTPALAGADALGFWWRDRVIRAAVARMTVSMHGVPAPVTVAAVWLPLPGEEEAPADTRDLSDEARP